MAQEITIKINAEGNIQGIDKAIKALTELDKQAQATSKKVEKSFSGKFLNGFAEDLKSLPLSFLGVAGSVAGLTSALSKSLDAFLSTEKAMIGLSTVARGVGEDIELTKNAPMNTTIRWATIGIFGIPFAKVANIYLTSPTQLRLKLNSTPPLSPI
jgi:hypothetical protein